jgi:hypothetical protein
MADFKNKKMRKEIMLRNVFKLGSAGLLRIIAA